MTRGLGRAEAVDDVDGGGEEHAMALETGGVAQRAGQMGFADSGGSEQHDVGVILEEAELEEVLDLHAIDLFGRGPVPAGHGFKDWKARGGQASCDAAIVGAGGFTGGQGFEVTEMGVACLGRLLGRRGGVFFHVTELQRLQMSLETRRQSAGRRGRWSGRGGFCFHGEG